MTEKKEINREELDDLIRGMRRSIKGRSIYKALKGHEVGDLLMTLGHLATLAIAIEDHGKECGEDHQGQLDVIQEIGTMIILTAIVRIGPDMIMTAIPDIEGGEYLAPFISRHTHAHNC